MKQADILLGRAMCKLQFGKHDWQPHSTGKVKCSRCHTFCPKFAFESPWSKTNMKKLRDDFRRKQEGA